MSVVVPVGEGTARFQWSLPAIGKEAVITCGVETTAAVLPSTWADLLSNALVASGVAAAASMLTGWRYDGCSVTYQDVTGPIVYDYPEAVSGTIVADALPINCAVLVSKRTGVGGRRGRGRMYWPITSIAESGVDAGGAILAAHRTTVQTRWDNFLTQVATDDLRLLVHHDNGAAGTPITDLIVEGTIATQRRRLR